MTVLGIETATTVCGAAAVRDDAVIAEAALEERHAHAERIMGFVERAVAAAGGLRAIDAVAVSIGPGSFTGLRIGLSVAKGLAYAADLKVVPVPTLEAIAWRLLSLGAVSPGERVLTILPARRGEAYAAWYSVGGPSPPGSGEPLALRLEADVAVRPVAALAAEAAASGALVTGDPGLLRAALPAGRSLRAADPSVAGASAVAVAQLGLALLRAGRTADPETLEPEYTLDFIALTKRP